MSRWIDGDAYERELRTSNIIHHYGEQIVDKIHSAPSIDIVRCKECKYASDNKVYGCMLNHFNDNDYGYHRMYANDFCSRGERKSDE